jgi:hypothetical protein
MIFNRGIDTMNITALSNHKPGILNNCIGITFNRIVNRYKAKQHITCKQIHQHMLDTNVVLKVDGID